MAKPQPKGLAKKFTDQDYRDSLNKEWERLEAGDITEDEFHSISNDLFDQFLAAKHLR